MTRRAGGPFHPRFHASKLRSHAERRNAANRVGDIIVITNGEVDKWRIKIREALEEAGHGVAAEVALLQEAKRMGLATFAFALSADDIQLFAKSGVDALIINAGLTPLQFAPGDRRDRLQETLVHIDRMMDAIEVGTQRPLCLIYGGPFTDVQDFGALFGQVRVDGIAGGSVFERLPVEAITSNFIQRCKALRLRDRRMWRHAARSLSVIHRPFARWFP